MCMAVAGEWSAESRLSGLESFMRYMWYMLKAAATKPHGEQNDTLWKNAVLRSKSKGILLLPYCPFTQFCQESLVQELPCSQLVRCQYTIMREGALG